MLYMTCISPCFLVHMDTFKKKTVSGFYSKEISYKDTLCFIVFYLCFFVTKMCGREPTLQIHVHAKYWSTRVYTKLHYDNATSVTSIPHQCVKMWSSKYTKWKTIMYRVIHTHRTIVYTTEIVVYIPKIVMYNGNV